MKTSIPTYLCLLIIVLQLFHVISDWNNKPATIELTNEQLSKLIAQIENSRDSNNNEFKLEQAILRLDQSLQDQFASLSDDKVDAPACIANQQNERTIISDQVNEESRREAFEYIEQRLIQATLNGAWTAADSEAIIQQASVISIEDKMHLLDLFSQAIEQGLTSVAEYPPPF